MHNLKRVVIAGLCSRRCRRWPSRRTIYWACSERPSRAPRSGCSSTAMRRPAARTGGTAKTGVCVTVGVANGHFSTIDTVAARDCGLKAVEESSAASAREPSREAMDACMDSADEMMEEPDGTSTVIHYEHSGENWVMTMHTAGQTSHLHGDAGRQDRDDDAVEGGRRGTSAAPGRRRKAHRKFCGIVCRIATATFVFPMRALFAPLDPKGRCHVA